MKLKDMQFPEWSYWHKVFKRLYRKAVRRHVWEATASMDGVTNYRERCERGY